MPQPYKVYVHWEAIEVLPKSGPRRTAVIGYIQSLDILAHIGGDYVRKDPETGRPFHVSPAFGALTATTLPERARCDRDGRYAWRSLRVAAGFRTNLGMEALDGSKGDSSDVDRGNGDIVVAAAKGGSEALSYGPRWRTDSSSALKVY